MLDADVDEAAEDPALLPLSSAVAGLLAVAGGLVWLALSFVLGVPGSIGVQALLIVGGFVLFVATMLWWDPDV